MRLTLLALCLTIAFACLTAPVQAAPEWKVIKVNGWDYLSVENVAQFYGFAGDATSIEKTIRLDNGQNQLEVTLDSREAIVNGVRNWLCFPIIEREGKYLVSRIDLAKTIEPQFRPHMIKNLGKIKTVVVDPGHGGTEKGAASPYGLEKDFCLDVALKLKPLLVAKGYNVIMTREKDETVTLPERARIANATKDSIFVSIHFNATDYNRDATGFEIYSLTPRGAPSTNDNAMLSHFAHMQAGSPVDAASLILSSSVYHAMLGYMPEFDRGVKRARFAVLRLTNIPAILVEGGFLTEREESREIASPQWRAKLAQSIAVGIDSYRGLAERRQRPLRLADYRRALDGVLVARNATAPAPAAAVVAPPILPAANIQPPAPDAQFTSAVRNEPSPVLDVNQTPAANASAPSHEAGDEHATSSAPPPVTAPSAADAQQVAQASNDSAEMPDAPEPAGAVNAYGDRIDTPPPGEGPTPPTKLTIWQKIARQLPPPKFRQ